MPPSGSGLPRPEPLVFFTLLARASVRKLTNQAHCVYHIATHTDHGPERILVEKFVIADGVMQAN